MKKILLLADEARARYHPLSPVRSYFDQALSGLGDVTVLCDQSAIPGGADAYDLIVSYADVWADTAEKKDNAALMAYVAGGGRLFAVHGGNIARHAPDLATMFGAMFTHHPHICPLSFAVTAPEDPIVAGVTPFTITEEPYMYNWDNLVEKQVLMTYAYEGQSYPALWKLSYGQGHVVCFTPGHRPDCFVEPVVRVLRQGARWLLEQEP